MDAIGRAVGRGALCLLVGGLSGLSAAANQGGVRVFCEGEGGGIELRAEGSAGLRANGGHGDLVLVARDAPAPFGWFLMGDQKLLRPPFGSAAGSLCVWGSPRPYAVLSLDAEQQVGEGAGRWRLRHTLDYLEGDALGAVVQPGSTWNFQFVHRARAELSVSNGLEIGFGPPVELVGWKTLAIGAYSQHPEAERPGVLLIEDAADWREFQLLHAGGAPAGPGLPEVDFERESVMAVFAGERATSGHAIQVEGLALSVTTLELRTQSRSPGAGCGVLPVLTYPFHIVRLPKIEGLQFGQWLDLERPAQACH